MKIAIDRKSDLENLMKTPYNNSEMTERRYFVQLTVLEGFQICLEPNDGAILDQARTFARICDEHGRYDECISTRQ